MTLQNLAKIGQLNAHKPTAEEVARLLTAVRRNLADAEVKGISNETRFDCGYKAIMQCALVAMMANGYRPSTSAPGHHQTMLQSLPLTLGVSNDAWIVLDALRKKRFTPAIRRFQKPLPDLPAYKLVFDNLNRSRHRSLVQCKTTPRGSGPYRYALPR